MLDLRQFAVLHAVRDQGSLSRAAQTLHLSLPTVVHHLAALERHLDARLVTRSPRGAALTPLGELFAGELDDVLDRLDLATTRLADGRQAGVVTLRVGTFSSAGSRLLPAALARLTSAMSLRLAVDEGEPTAIAARVRDGSLHCALVYDLSGDPALDLAGLHRIELEEEPFTLIASARSGLDGDDLDLATLADHAWLRSRSPAEASDRLLDRLSAAAGFEPRTLLRTDDYAMVHGLVAADLGVALVADTSVDSRFAVRRLATRQPLGARRVSFVLPESAPVRAAVELGSLLREGRLGPGRG